MTELVQIHAAWECALLGCGCQEEIARLREKIDALTDAAHIRDESNKVSQEVFATLIEALKFYADPETYHAIFIVPDNPAGAFAEDFSADHGDAFYDRPMPGATARAALEKL